MKTGTGEHDTSAFVESAMSLVMEMMIKASLLAGYYSKACDRTVLTSQDLQYCMKYVAMNFQSTPEILEQFDVGEDEDEDEDMETVDEDEEPFVRYSGTNKIMLKINKSYDNWSSWNPESPLEKRFKEAIDNIHT